MAESSPLSNNSSSCINRADLSEEEVMLASNNSKKRAGRKKFQEIRHPVYRGVRKRNSNKWVFEVRETNKKSRIWLGTYPSADMAARAHDVATIALRGRFACLNFVDSVWKLPIPTSSDANDIQRVAAKAAEAFRPSDQSERVSGEYPEMLESNKSFMDEEALFCMPGLLTNMAEGLMLPPPHYVKVGDNVETAADMTLWSYSI
ncbi:dehydration-responsive element-binding protein 1D-like [Nicotiana tabacum]|uniref:Dehydration-responsive element-binding protein 1D-like n=1 Tax=Nicotiana tabacum TaxID=4097 RepID=A0A1S4D0E9_TOBAC|nr:PREDICTED: dehydration-responsive element-binding protein 1D-like [Nicotiana tabacum]